MPGTIELIHLGNVVQTKSYDGPARRNKIIKGWKRLYGKGFNMATINDIPDSKIIISRTFAKGDIPKTFASPVKKVLAMRKDLFRNKNAG